MARAQQRGVNALTVWFIVFVTMWLAATVFLVVLYTDQEKLRQDRDDLRDRKERAVSTQQENSIELLREARKGGPTMVGLLDEARSQTAKLAVGDASADVATIQAKVDTFRERLRQEQILQNAEQFPDSLYDGLDYLYGVFLKEHELRTQAEARAETLNNQIEQAIASNTAQKEGFDSKVDALQAKLADCQSSRDNVSTDHNTQLQGLEKQYNDLRADLTTQITDAREKTSAAQQRYAELLHRYTELQKKLGSLQVSPGANVTARQADGRILKAVPGDKSIYINLGARDALVLGMEFAVYSPEEGIPASGRAKARVRVEAIHPSSAECKVMRVFRNEIVMEGDLVANPIYDRNRPLTFVVVGDFDLDGDGAADNAGEFGVEAIIKDWGGQVGTELTALTDFVIVGLEPSAPKTGGSMPQDVLDREKVIERRHERYMQILNSARTLSVPVLTQEVFLHFLGYAGGERTLSSIAS